MSRWHADAGTPCRFCGDSLGEVFEEPNTSHQAFHLECIVKSWKRGEKRLQDQLKIEEENGRLKNQIGQLRTALLDAQSRAEVQRAERARGDEFMRVGQPQPRVSPSEQQQALVGRANLAFNSIAARLDLKLTPAQQAMLDSVQNTVVSSPRSLTEQQVTAIESLLKAPPKPKEEKHEDRFSLIELE